MALQAKRMEHFQEGVFAAIDRKVAAQGRKARL